MKKIFEQVIIGIVIVGVTATFNLFVSYLSTEKIEIRVGDAIEYNTNTYLMPIDIFNFNDNIIDSIVISLPISIETNNIKSFSPIKIDKIKNNIGNTSKSSFEIQRILGNSQVRLFLEINKNIPATQIKFFTNDHKVKMEYPDDVKSPFVKDLIVILINSLAYAVMIISVNIYFDKKREKEEQKRMLECTNLSKRIEDMSVENKKIIDDIKVDVKKSFNNEKKKNLILLSRINDYRKELEFWRDSIRKLLMLSKKDTSTSEILIKTVTNNLKTYQTNRKDDMPLDNIYLLADIIKDYDKK